MEKDFKKILEELKGKIPPGELKRFETVIEESVKSGKTPRSFLELSDKVLAGLYAEAYHLYNAGKFDEALKIFLLLQILDTQDTRFLFGAASCYFMLKKFPEALALYLVCREVDPQETQIYWYMANCYKQMGNKAAALLALRLLLRYSSQPTPITQHAEREIVILDRELEKDSPTEHLNT